MGKKTETYVVTTLASNPHDDYHKRVKSYSIIMGLRLFCILLLFLIPFPWNIIPILIAVFSPWFAVVVANVKKPGTSATIEKPYKALE